MKTESEVGIIIPTSKLQKRVAEATIVSRRALCRVLKGENVENVIIIIISSLSDDRFKASSKTIPPHSTI
jgi:hypothetical protein